MASKKVPKVPTVTLTDEKFCDLLDLLSHDSRRFVVDDMDAEVFDNDMSLYDMVQFYSHGDNDPRIIDLMLKIIIEMGKFKFEEKRKVEHLLIKRIA